MDIEIVEQGLKNTASAAERVKALREAGMPAAIIAAAVGVSVQALRDWKSGSEPRPAPYDRLDALRLTMGRLIAAQGLEPNEAANWLLSRSDEPPHKKPIDEFTEDPEGFLSRISTS